MDKVGIVRLAKVVGVGIVALGPAQADEGQIGAVGTEIAARDGIDIDEVAEAGRSAEESDLRPLRNDGDIDAKWREQWNRPRPGHEAYRVGVVKAAGIVHHADNARGAGANRGNGSIEMKGGASATG